MNFDDYAAWRLANLLDNTERGIVGEYLVGTALGCPGEGHRNWLPYDLHSADGTAIEVKSAGRLQAWGDGAPQSPTFSVGRATRWWDHEHGCYRGEEKQRWSRVMVFALHDWTDRGTAHPLDEKQWRFWVVPTSAIAAEFGGREGRAGIARLERMGAVSCIWDELPTAVSLSTIHEIEQE